jgi:phage shock protein PspC (stress-responsive transcriptional regulator)
VNPRHLYRCRRDRQLAGVAAGVAEYFDLDPTVVRILWILSAFFGGFSILLYIILAFVVPFEPDSPAGPDSWHPGGPAWSSAPTGAGTDRPDASPGNVGEPGAGTPVQGGAIPGWPAPAPDHRHPARGRGRGGLYLGALLVAFGVIALVNAAVPGWAGATWFGPAVLVALGVALLAGSIRRGENEPDGRPNAG